MITRAKWTRCWTRWSATFCASANRARRAARIRSRNWSTRPSPRLRIFISGKGMLTGVATGFTDLDKMTDGLHGGEMIVIAARPSMGKTSLAMNIAEHVALEQKLPVGVFSLEMTAESLVLRMLCSRARVNLRNIREGFMTESDFPKLTRRRPASWPARRCSLTTRRGFRFCSCGRKARRHAAAIWHQAFRD